MGSSEPVNVSTVADLFNVTRRRVNQLVVEGMPQIARGKYDLFACAKWYINFLQERNKEAGSGTSNNELKDKRTRYVQIQADTAELEYRKRKGELVELQEVQLIFNEAMVIVATELHALCGRAADELANISEAALIREKLLDETNRTRNNAADKLESFKHTAAGIKDTSPATAKNAGRMGKRKQNTANRKRRTRPVQK